jgi:ribonuclease J
MLHKKPPFQMPSKGIYFMSLGGIGEIGANCYLYCCDDKWLMIDLGLTFADEQFPGIDLLLPKIDFVDEMVDHLEAIVISHGHEDHAGAVAFFADKINCPVYATGFARSLIENRLKEFGSLDKIKLITINPKKHIKLKNFELSFIATTHSIPEPHAILIDTKYGKLLHTADWKIDTEPTLGEGIDIDSFKQIGNDGLLAIIGDSTNADVPGFSRSEAEVLEELIKVFSRYNKRIVITCFSSNIARMNSIAIAAKKNNRKVSLVGRSMKKTIDAAITNKIISENSNFISEEEASLIPRENLVVICTGSQGEKRSALYRIAYNAHRHIHLEKDDVVIFSSRDIPGNEKSINNLKNLLIRQRVEIITTENDLVHVSGHGYAEEIKKMYEWTRPYIALPVHGEAKHLVAHAQLAQASQVPITKILENGKCIKLAPNDPEIYGSIDTGKLIVEGRNIYDSESNFIKDRRRSSFEGIVLVSIIINSDFSIHKNIKITANGLSNFDSNKILELFKEIFLKEYMQINSEKKSSDSFLSEQIKKSIRLSLKSQSSKKPEVKSHIIRL